MTHSGRPEINPEWSFRWIGELNRIIFVGQICFRVFNRNCQNYSRIIFSLSDVYSKSKMFKLTLPLLWSLKFYTNWSIGIFLILTVQSIKQQQQHYNKMVITLIKTPQNYHKDIQATQANNQRNYSGTNW